MKNKYICTYYNFEQTNEGMKNWLTTFLLLANLGLVPLSVKTANAEVKKEFVNSQSDSKIDAAKFIEFLNIGKYDKSLDLENVWNTFTTNDKSVTSSFDETNKYISKNGKLYSFAKTYKVNDFSNVDINKFTPNNWLTDMGSFIADSLEPEINNIISDYESKTSIEIGIVTVKSLDEDIFEYSQKQFGRLGIGKKGANNGILIVFSMDDRKSRIHTGRGMEEFLTDAHCSRLLRNVVAPNFKKGDYYGGTKSLILAIEKELGDEAFSKKVEWLKLKKQKEEIEYQKSIEGVKDFFTSLFLLLIVLGPIGYGVYRLHKHRKDKEEARKIREELLLNIDKGIREINDIKGNLPKNNINSDRLDTYLNKLKNDINSINIERDSNTTDEVYLEILKEYKRNCDHMISGYQSTKSNILSKIADISKIDNIIFTSNKKAEQALNAYDSVIKYGYSISKPESIDEFIKVSKIAQDAKDLMSAEQIDNSIRKYEEYITKSSSLISSGQAAISMLSKITNAKSRVEKANDIIDDSIKSMMSYKNWARSSESDEVTSIINSLLPKISGNRFIEMEEILNKILSKIDETKLKWKKRKDDEERKKREEEEEERRRKRRREEEESRSSSSYYSSSSSSSSSSSFGSFGGGDSGGGGASSGW